MKACSRKDAVTAKWKCRRPREYQRRSAAPVQYIAQVFSSPKGYDWAWVVWHEKGRECGMELTFKDAKAMADEVIERLETQPMTLSPEPSTSN